MLAVIPHKALLQPDNLIPTGNPKHWQSRRRDGLSATAPDAIPDPEKPHPQPRLDNEIHRYVLHAGDDEYSAGPDHDRDTQLARASQGYEWGEAWHK